jgi:beta-1,4-N-acetylglucosaminyltransferase
MLSLERSIDLHVDPQSLNGADCCREHPLLPFVSAAVPGRSCPATVLPALLLVWSHRSHSSRTQQLQLRCRRTVADALSSNSTTSATGKTTLADMASSKKKKAVHSRVAEIQQRAAIAAPDAAASTSASTSSAVASISPPELAPPSAADKLLFLTVGTTNFDQLVAQLNADATRFVDWLVANRFTRVVFQLGHGKVLPDALQAASSSLRSVSSPRIEYFRHSPGIVTWMSHAALIISHAGAGSIMEALRLNKPLLVVINTSLMHNHQLEVARALEVDRYLYQCEPEQVVDVLSRANWSTPTSAANAKPSSSDSSTSYHLLSYPPVTGTAFPQLLSEHAKELRAGSSAIERMVTVAVPLALAATAMFAVLGSI